MSRAATLLSRNKRDLTKITVGFFMFETFSVVYGALLWPYIINVYLINIGYEGEAMWAHGALLGLLPASPVLSTAFLIALYIINMFIPLIGLSL